MPVPYIFGLYIFMLKMWFRQHGLRILFRIFLFVAILELLPRLGGAVFLFLQERSSRPALAGQQEYRILCLGESTTALGGEDAYPRQLEKALNSSSAGRKFTLINKGVPAITTTKILARLDQYLAQYSPQIVVTMMGINDLQDFNRRQALPLVPGFLKEMRLYKILTTLKDHWEKEQEEEKAREADEFLKTLELRLDKRPNAGGYIQLGMILRATDNEKDAIRAFTRAAELEPANCRALGYLALSYKQQGEYTKAEEYFDRVIAACPAERVFYEDHLIDMYYWIGRKDRVIDILKKEIQDTPVHPLAYGQLAHVYFDQGRFDRAEEMCKRQIAINSKLSSSYMLLSNIYRLKGDYPAAVDILKDALVKLPADRPLNTELGALLFKMKRYGEAEAAFSKVLAAEGEGPNTDLKVIYEYLAAVYDAQGEAAKARELRRKIQAGAYNRTTYENYNRMNDRLAERGIQLIVMQYPLRDVAELKALLDPPGRTLFVDNREIFAGAAAGEYDRFFTDHFAVDFGHATPEGNRLLAENLAKTILNFVEGEK